MPIKSNNTQGNQYHDEGTGQFTSADNNGVKKSEESEAMKLFGLKHEDEQPKKKKWYAGTLDELDVNEDEEQQASNLFGVDVSEKKGSNIDYADSEMAEFLKLDYKGRNQAKKEGRLPKQFEKLDRQTIRSLLDGYNESMTPVPTSVSVKRNVQSGPSYSYYIDGDERSEYDTEEVENEVEISSEDVIGFLKMNNVKLSPEDEQDIRDNQLISARVLKEAFGEDYDEDKLYRDLVDLKEGE